MSTPLAYAHRHAKVLRRRMHAVEVRLKAVRRVRNLIARDLLKPNGPYRPKVKPSRKRPIRRPRHRLRFLAEAMA